MNRVPKKQRGFGLVELMIAVTLGILLSTAVVQVFLATSSSSRMLDSMAQIQENARFAMRFLSREIRMAGYIGCSSISAADFNNIAKPVTTTFTPDTALVGVDNVGSSDALSAVIGTDRITIKRATDQFITITGNLSPDNANIKIEDNSIGFVKNDFVIITDCLNGDMFRITNNPKNKGEGQTTLTHANGSNTDNRLSKIYTGEAEVFGFEEIEFFIGDTGRKSSAGNPINALYFQKLTLGSGGVVSPRTELVEGIENMQLSYGVDTNDDRAVEVYQTAAEVADWAKVLSVRIELIMYGSEDNVVGKTGSVNAQLLNDASGDLVANNDGRLRKVFTNVFTIRNRLQ
ncbi:MAG: PilW family protein [Zhongshania sp.]|uniref:PilW family protein n=1 Tax=Zhongshania sp. TaxID=1971902 RepID=UPI002606EC20|nr:PilW family protein [Zhongshania sp.]MDF1691175.1 PilW family protein [Zhongshania sp.]